MSEPRVKSSWSKTKAITGANKNLKKAPKFKKVETSRKRTLRPR